MKMAVPGTRGMRSLRQFAQEVVDRQRSAAASRSREDLPAACATSSSAVKTTRPTASGNQPPSATLTMFAPKKARSMIRNGTVKRATAISDQLPALALDDGQEHRGDAHRRGDGHAVRGGEVARLLERQHQADGGEHQRPVDRRDVDLPDLARRRVADRGCAADSRAARPGASARTRRRSPPATR